MKKQSNFVKASTYTEEQKQNLDITSHVQVPPINPHPTKRRLDKCNRCGRGLMIKNLWEGVYYCGNCGEKHDPATIRRKIFLTFK